jgi:predicted DsbA family dithiol-disulfide isomerase
MRQVEVTIFVDYVCPYCYIGADRGRRLEEEFGVKAKWKSFELHPEAPDGGIPPSMYYENNPGLKSISENARLLAREAALTLGTHVVYSNSRLALELGVWADGQGRGPEYRDALFDFYYHRLQDIGDEEVLLAIAESIMMSREDAQRCIEERTMKPTVDAQIDEARQLGIGGVPTYIIGKEYVSGAQPYGLIREIYQRASAGNQ